MTKKSRVSGPAVRMEASIRLLKGEPISDIAEDIGFQERTIMRWWVALDPKDRAKATIAARKIKLQEQYAQHSLLLEALRAEIEKSGTKDFKSGRVSGLQLAAATAQDKIVMAEGELADLEAKTGAGRKVRPKNSHKEG